jgi:hypothetical protein
MVTLYPGALKPTSAVFFSDFVVGFDLVGQEDVGRPLIEFAQILIEAKIKYPNLK